MAFPPPPGALIDGCSGLLLVALGLVVARSGARAPGAAAFAVFAVSFGVAAALPNFADPGTAWRAVAEQVAVAASLVALVALLTFLAQFPRPIEKRELPLLILPGAVFVALLAWYLHAWSRVGFRLVWIDGLLLLQAGFLSGAVLLPLRYAAARGVGVERLRGQYALLAAAFALWPGLLLATRLFVLLITHVTYLIPFDAGAFDFASSGMGYVGSFALLAASALWIGNTRHHPSATARNLAILVLAVPVGVVVLYWAYNHQVQLGSTGLYGLSRVATGAMLAYAVTRHHVFDLGLRVKRGVERASLAVLVVATVGVTLELAGNQFGAPAGTVIALGVLAVALLQVDGLRRGVARLADLAMPHVGAGEYLNLRKLDVYRAVLEQTVAAGRADDPDEQAALAELRAELGVSERDHAVLSSAMGARAVAAAPRALQPGSVVLGRYRLERLLGEGAHGRAFLARDARNRDQPVVVKAAHVGAGSNAAALREARAIAGLRHPNVIALHEAHEDGPALLLVSEYAEGGSLKARIAAGGPLPARELRRVARGLLDGLAAVHDAGIIHRDVKPSNVLLDSEGRAKIADFGVARLPGAESTFGAPHGSSILGTLRYMSPEQARGRRPTARSDLWSAGTTLYEAWSGSPYFEVDPRESHIELQMRIAAAPAFDRHVEPPALRAWFARALAPDPEARFGSAREMRDALDAALAD